MHKMLMAALMVMILSVTSAAAVLSNERLCERGVEEFADSIMLQLSPPPDSGVYLFPIEGRFGRQLLNILAMRLQKSGTTVFLVSEGVDPKRPVVKTAVDDYHLTYEGIQRGFFSQGRVVRVFGISGSSQMLGNNGRLLQTATVSSLLLCDTLSYGDARTVRGADSFLSPKMPATMYQRLVEPGLILGITGALVYLFFASR